MLRSDSMSGTPGGEYELHPLSKAVMKKFNNTLEGTDCGDAGLPARSYDIARAKTVLHVVPKMSDNAFPDRCAHHQKAVAAAVPMSGPCK
jgi:hypothetical protein